MQSRAPKQAPTDISVGALAISPTQFSESVLTWFKQHGRKNLPWQQQITPYRVWVSEIMLQQTQVATVIPYFQRFISRFPDVASLASAQLDEVLHLWTGLGYYARARHLYRAAQIIYHQYAGHFPQEIAALSSLPGIGRSTAGAILAIAMRKSAPILDGNVKRVFTRFHAIAGWPGDTSVAKQLWEYATHYTPDQHCAAYTQAMMDLGATICTRSKPRCDQCPLQRHCLAYAMANPTAYPTKKPSKNLPKRAVRLVILTNQQGEVLLEKRPPLGIWGGLWSFPECPADVDVKTWCQQHYVSHVDSLYQGTPFRHTFSHFHLDITPVQMQITHPAMQVMEQTNTIWQHPKQPISYGLPAPIARLLTKLAILERI